jgi:hypothetical protein
VHGVDVVGVASGDAEVALVAGELGPDVVLVEGGGLLAGDEAAADGCFSPVGDP